MPNSSPPKRATMSPGRRWARSRGATARSSASPAWWPMLSLISLKWSRSRKRIPTGEPDAVARRSASLSASTKLSRLGRPVSESCRTRWRSAWSATWRSIASASTFAAACTKWTSCGVKRLGSIEWTSSTPNGWSLPSITTARLLPTPSTRSTGGIVKRCSVAQSATITCRPESSAAPAWESRAAETRRLAPVTWPSSPARRRRRRPSRPTSQMQAPCDAVDPLDQRDRRPHQRLGVAVLQRPLAELGDDGLLGDSALQLLLGDLALGDVVEDPVPDGNPVLVGLQHRLVEDPDDVAVAGDHPVVDRRRVALADRLPGLLGQRPLPVVGVQQLRPQLRVLPPILGAVAEDLLDLRADVAPAPVLAELGGVDDRGKALDQAAVVLAARGDLVEKFVDLLVGPVPISRRPVHSPRLSTDRRVP